MPIGPAGRGILRGMIRAHDGPDAAPPGASEARRFRLALALAAAVLPLLVFRSAAEAPLSTIPCEVTTPNCLNGDPLLVTSVLARAWSRFDRGDFATHDDRVFAPYPDAWAMGEPFLLPSLLGYPWARLSGAPAAGYNLALWVACAVSLVSAGALFTRLAGPGLPAFLGAVLFAWGPARMNNLGVLSILWAGLLPLAIAFGLDALDGRRRACPLFAAAWLALGLGSLYGLLMGALVAGLVLALAALPVPARRRRLPAVAAAAGLAALPLLLVYRPFFRLERDFDARVPRTAMEGQSADVLSLLHAGSFTGPVGRTLERIGPAFPAGSAALFPTVAALFAFGLLCGVRPAGAPRRGAPETRLAPWAAVAAASLLFALGPTIRVAGVPLAPGPWALLGPLPVFRSLRGLFRWDQWWDLALAALFVLALSRASGALAGRARRAGLLAAAALVALDVWPRPVPAAVVPARGPFTDAMRALPRDAIVAVHPYVRETATRGTFEQTLHGRRLLDSYQTFAPPVHLWLFSKTASSPLAESLALYRELGASAVDVDPDRLDADARAGLATLLRGPGAPAAVRAAGGSSRILLLLPREEPVLLDPASATGLLFRDGLALAPGPPGRLAFRLRRAVWPATIRFRGVDSPATLTWDLVGAGGLRVRLVPAGPPGSEVRDAGRAIGRIE